MHILNSILKGTNRKIFSHILCVLDVSFSATDSIKIFHSLLWKYYVHPCGEKQVSPSKGSCKLGPHGDQDAKLVEVTKRWPEWISHTEKAKMINEFHSQTSSSALRCFTFVSCAECIHSVKWMDLPLMDINLNLLHHPPLSTPGFNCAAPPMHLLALQNHSM